MREDIIGTFFGRILSLIYIKLMFVEGIESR